MTSWIIGAVLLIGGILLALLAPKRIRDKNIEIRYMQATSLGDLRDILSHNASAGLEGYRHYAELTGTADPDEPQEAPFSGKQAAYYHADLYHVFEQSETVQGPKGAEQRVRKDQTLLSSQKSSAPVALRESQGQDKAYIDPSQGGLQLGTVRTLDKFEPAANMDRYGFFKGMQVKDSVGTRTLGYRMVENTIPIGAALYALGDAVLENGRIGLFRPKDKKPFILTTKRKEEVVRANKSGATAAMVFGILIAVGGILVMLLMR